MDWDGTWRTVVITSVGNDARARAALRNHLQEQRFAELREGVWMRPDNVEIAFGVEAMKLVRILRSEDERPRELAEMLWDLPKWAAVGHALLDDIADAADVPARFVVAAAVIRHLLTDPVLPDGLLPPDWPGAALRRAYSDFAAELVRQRDGIDLLEAR